ncbi:TPA: hypothetical protein N0F65_009927 [Lagenidium giganteum]|uniref:PITH domain-containing protein n=1 Tax=Lagenidium giganteum TaxID=4803 RepID=A0AAV2YJS9_9STRA|nr:TPA: hypothetical protein N0F65_009927 [Lagenidium giganteum]
MAAAAAPKTRAFKDLSDAIDRSGCYCLNENPKFPYTNLFIGDATLQLKSDADEQLIVHIEFQDAVKIHSLNIVAPAGEAAPRVLKLFANRSNLGFSDVGDIEPTQTIELKESDLDPNHDIELRFVKFQRVKSITVFVEENGGADETIISSLKLFGERIAGTNMDDLKKVPDDGDNAIAIMRGRGRGRVRFGGSRDPALADVLDETREDLGLSHTQMEQLHAENASALYPPMQLPQPEPLNDRDAYLVQKQRVLAHKLDNLYQQWEQDGLTASSVGGNKLDPMALVHVTIPETQKADQVFVPDELMANTLSGVRNAQLSSRHNVMKPRAFENVFKSLEAQEQKLSDKTNGADNEADDDDMDEPEEDLTRNDCSLGQVSTL